MNKPTYQAIRTHSPTKPALVFVSSRRQTRLTALDLINLCAAEEDPKQFLHMDSDDELEMVQAQVHDPNLRLVLSFGIGIHHAGLPESDRRLVEGLFIAQKIQVLVATSTLAWGVNTPAHLVVVKGTEYFDGKQCRYVDFPITDVLQMMGRAGRPQYDEEGVAVVFVHDVKKKFYQKFLYEPFPVESSLAAVLADHLNAEIVAGTISSMQQAADFLSWTYYYRRVCVNPTYYGLEDASSAGINAFVSTLVRNAVDELVRSGCVVLPEDKEASKGPGAIGSVFGRAAGAAAGEAVESTPLGRVASYYYLTHRTVRLFHEEMHARCTVDELVVVLASAHEYDELPVRHNEDILNRELSEQLDAELDRRGQRRYGRAAKGRYGYDSSHMKALLLLEAHFARVSLPSADYVTDTRSVMDQAVRIVQAMTDVAADAGWLSTALECVQLLQMLYQGAHHEDHTLLQLPHVTVPVVEASGIDTVARLLDVKQGKGQLEKLTRLLKSREHAQAVQQCVMRQLPSVDVHWRLPHSNELASGGAQYALHVTLRDERQRGERAHAPAFPKQPVASGNWFLAVGCVERDELIALKRVTLSGGARDKRSKKGGSGQSGGSGVSVRLNIATPEHSGEFAYTLYLMSDCYRGLDQQIPLGPFVACEIVIPDDIFDV